VHLTLHADYSLRVLLYLATYPERPVSTAEVSEAYGISKHHLVRVVQSLGRHGYVEIRPGRSGGVLLAKLPSAIKLGEVVRRMEPDLNLVECFEPARNTCPILPVCGLRHALQDAINAFMAVLDKLTLADVMAFNDGDLRDYFLNKPIVRSMR
jgi:Rrf2 family nitric oxide-sensitive transcriptional repressor